MDDHTADLAAWIVQHDETAFSRLVERYNGLVSAVCRRQLDDRAIADEATQAVFIILARRAASVSNPQALESWLHQVAVGVCRNARRAAASRQRHERNAAMHHSENQPGTVAQSSAWTDLRPLLDDAIATLDARERAVVIGHFLHGQQQAVVARCQGITEKTVRKDIASALGKLRLWFNRRDLSVGASVLVAGLMSEASASEPVLAAACTQAALHPASAAGANALASSAVGGGFAKLAIGALAAGLVLAGGALAITRFRVPPAPSMAPPAMEAASPTPAAPAAPSLPKESVLWSDGFEDLAAWGREPFGDACGLWPMLPLETETHTVHGGAQALRLRYHFPNASVGAAESVRFADNYQSLARPIRLPVEAQRLRIWVHRVTADPGAWLLVRLRNDDSIWETVLRLSTVSEEWNPVDLDLLHPGGYWRQGMDDTRLSDCPRVDNAGVTHLVLVAGGGDFDIVADDVEVSVPADQPQRGDAP